MIKEIIYFLFLLVLVSCNRPYQEQIVYKSNNEATDFFIDANKNIIQNEESKIDSLVKRLTVPFLSHPTGIRLFIDKDSSLIENINYPKKGDVVIVEYSCVVFDSIETLVDDDLIDTLSFKIGHSKQMKGLNYAIKLLQIGDKAKIIIPSYLGFGMSGYGKTVPPYSTLLLNVKLLNIE